MKELTARFISLNPVYWPNPGALKIRHRLSGEVAILVNNVLPYEVIRKCGDRTQVDHYSTLESFLKKWQVAGQLHKEGE